MKIKNSVDPKKRKLEIAEEKANELEGSEKKFPIMKHRKKEKKKGTKEEYEAKKIK